MPGTNGARPGVWVTEYSDFSAKYGLAYKLSYGHTGAAFNDGTKMVWDSDLKYVSLLYLHAAKHTCVPIMFEGGMLFFGECLGSVVGFQLL